MMTAGQVTQRLFSNDVMSQWVQWALAMLVGGIIAWQALQGRVTSAEAEIASLRRDVAFLRADVTELRQVVNGGFAGMNATVLQLHGGR